MTTHPAARAGASAQAEFERRSARHDAEVRRARPRILVVAAVGLVLGLALTLAGGTLALLGLSVSGVSLLGAASSLLVRPPHVRAWAVGAEGERQTGDLLARLEVQGFRVLHDLRMPGTPANIDHVVIGPTGVFVVETKSWSGALRVRDGVLRIAGRPSAVIEQVTRQADAVSVALPGTRVRPFVCVHRADLPFRPIELEGVAVVNPGGLLQRLRAGPAWLTPAEIDRLAARLDGRLSRTA